MVRRSFFILAIVIALALSSFIYAEYTSVPYVAFNSINFLNPTLSTGSYTNAGYLLINASGNLSFNLPTGVFNLSISLFNATALVNVTAGIVNMTNITGPNVQGAIQINVPDGVYNISLIISNATFSNSTSRSNITGDTKNPNMSIIYPALNANLSFWNLTINVTCIDDNFNQSIITVYNSLGGVVGTQVVTSTNVSINATADGRYSIFATSYDRAGNINTTSRNITLDTTPPVVVIYSPLNNTNYYANQSIVVNFGAIETNPVNYWYYNSSGGSNPNISFTPGILQNINFSSLGPYNLTFSVNDSTAHTTDVRIVVNIIALPTTSVVANSSASSLAVGASVSNIVVPYNSSLQNVSLTNSSQSVSFDLSQVLDTSIGRVTAANNFSLVTQGTYNYTVYIPQYVNMTGGPNWDGKINLPTFNSSISSFTAPSSGTTTAVIDVGEGSTSVNFSSPVEVIIGGMGGQSAAWASGTSGLTNIPTVCNGAIPTNIDPSTNRECYNSTGSDLIIWTYHFTSFAAYTPAATAAAATVAGSGSASTTTQQNLTIGVDKIFSTGDVLTFPFDSRTYMLMLVYTRGNNAVIQFSPNLQQATLAVGEEKNFDLNKDGKNDVSVKINNLDGIKADITIKFITETAAPINETPTPTNTVGEIVTKTTETMAGWSLAKKITVGVGIIIAIVLIVLGIIFLRKNSSGSRAKEHVKTFEFARKS